MHKIKSSGGGGGGRTAPSMSTLGSTPVNGYEYKVKQITSTLSQKGFCSQVLVLDNSGHLYSVQCSPLGLPI